MPEEHPNCPWCNSKNTREIMLKGSQIPSEFTASTDYECLNCEAQWISGDYLVRMGHLIVVDDETRSEK